MLFDKLKHLEKLRRKALKDPQLEPSLAPFFAAPLPSHDSPLRNLDFVALDFETTGLDFAHDKVLSIGGVKMHGLQIDFGSCFHHFLVEPECCINPQAALINQITPEALAQGMSLNEARDFLIDTLHGHIIICHAAVIEHSFLFNMLGLKSSFPLPLIFLDTMKIERSLIHRPQGKEDLRLATIRQKRQLPPYVAHNALADAVATAEVFLAQVKDVFGKDEPKLGPLFSRSC